MRILYAVQGTGNGHVCRAQDIIPALKKRADVHILVSGIQSDIGLPFPVDYKFNGLSFIFGKKGGVDLLETYKKSHLRKLLQEVRSLPVEDYDLVISDFEPVSSWACYLNNIGCIALSHQAAVMDKLSPQPAKTDTVGKAIMKVYAPASVHYGFHFASYAANIFTPVIRKQVRQAPTGNKGHYTVYLPAYSDERIIKTLSQFPGIRWEVFSKHNTKPQSVGNIDIFPVRGEAFITSMAAAEGVLCGAGFETPAEALYLKKKLLVIPMKNQFEQHCNAAALRSMGVPVIKSLKPKHIEKIQAWLDSSEKVVVDYPDNAEEVVNHVLDLHLKPREQASHSLREKISVRDLRAMTFKKIISKLSH